VFGRIFGTKGEKETGGWKKMHKNELHNFYSSYNIIKVVKSMRVRRVEHVVSPRQTRNTYKILVEKREGNIPLRR
jgi:hypothetical protein